MSDLKLPFLHKGRVSRKNCRTGKRIYSCLDAAIYHKNGHGYRWSKAGKHYWQRRKVVRSRMKNSLDEDVSYISISKINSTFGRLR